MFGFWYKYGRFCIEHAGSCSCHPYNHSKSNLLGVARGFWQQGFALFLFDFRSFAHNPTPQSIGFYEQRDARAAIECAKCISPVETKIGLMGASMGAAVSLIVGHEDEPDVVGICADCIFQSKMMNFVLKRWVFELKMTKSVIFKVRL